ncbi:hypothetical protein BK133_05240 [Paenibacillus sp. FSL H8-0548]|uniref:hypothetical protein n=1 Tax=Paenibacillus sp. FSL H8-0548 TaxID=1920422 RepID=UPI00096BD724|nr:hypothetical protein [Paenibacillus sp. FSL H8-0548]OMF37462.1 hypothetical protein BK133_05240 [Paenibacillus sp. FSL H8-0548]
MLQQALQKLSAEIGAADKKNKYVPVIGGFLINHVRENPDQAALILTKGKTIDGSLAEMAKVAQKEAYKGRAVMSDEDGFNIVLKYFGVTIPDLPIAPAAPASFAVSIDDLL